MYVCEVMVGWEVGRATGNSLFSFPGSCSWQIVINNTTWQITSYSKEKEKHTTPLENNCQGKVTNMLLPTQHFCKQWLWSKSPSCTPHPCPYGTNEFSYLVWLWMVTIYNFLRGPVPIQYPRIVWCFNKHQWLTAMETSSYSILVRNAC